MENNGGKIKWMHFENSIQIMVESLYLHSLGDIFVLKEYNMSSLYQEHHSKMEWLRD